MKIKKTQLNLILLIFLSVVVVLLTPFGYHIDLGPGTNSIISIIWDYSIEYDFRFFLALRYYLEYCIFRFVILIAISTYFLEKLSRRWLIISSVIGELIPLILSIPASIILNNQGENLYPIIIPIPILLLYIILIDHIFKIKKKNNN